MTTVYPVIFTRTDDDKDTYLIEIPDLDGITEGFGLAGSIKMARDLIGCKLYNLEESQYPKATQVNEIDVTKGEFAGEGSSMV